jgi:hypothetical protein
MVNLPGEVVASFIFTPEPRSSTTGMVSGSIFSLGCVSVRSRSGLGDSPLLLSRCPVQVETSYQRRRPEAEPVTRRRCTP